MEENCIQTYFSDIKDFSLLSEEKERELAVANQKEELVIHNLRLAASIAKTYQNRGLPLEDLIQEANMGLMLAAEKYDVSTGYRFSTYAGWWIKHSLSRAIEEHSRTIRIPSHIYETYNKIEKETTRLRAELGRGPTNAEVAAAINKSEEEIRNIKGYFCDPMSIDATFGEDDDTIGSVIEDTTLESPIEYCLEFTNSEIVDKVLKTLSEKEEQIIRLTFQENMTLVEVGNRMGISHENARMVQMKALRKLRHPFRANILRSVMI